MEPTTLNCTVLGDAGIGKTSLLLSLSLNYFSSASVPTCIEGLIAKTTIDDKLFEIKLFDIPGAEWETVRMALYPNRKERLAINAMHPTPDVVLVCFSVDSPPSLASVREKWGGELRARFKGIPWLLVGTKVDRRDGSKDAVVFAEDGRVVAGSLGAVGYVECSSFTQEGVKQLLTDAVRVALEGNRGKSEKKKDHSCLIQ